MRIRYRRDRFSKFHRIHKEDADEFETNSND